MVAKVGVAFVIFGIRETRSRRVAEACSHCNELKIRDLLIMKKLFLTTAVATLAFSSNAAFAEDTDTLTVNMTGNVEQICTAVPKPGFAGSNFNGGSGSYTPADDTVNVLFDFGIDNTDDPTQANVGQTNQAFFSVAFDTFCNDDFTVTATPSNGAFNNAASAPTGFTNTLPYGMTFKKIGVASLSVGNVAATTYTLSGPAFDGTTQIDFNVKPSTVAPVAGDYSETMTVTFAADS